MLFWIGVVVGLILLGALCWWCFAPILALFNPAIKNVGRISKQVLDLSKSPVVSTDGFEAEDYAKV